MDNIPKGDDTLNEWIPVKERLPEETGYYLTTWQGIHSDVPVVRYNRYCEWDRRFEIDGVIAWMPLPEPYKTTNQ